MGRPDLMSACLHGCVGTVHESHLFFKVVRSLLLHHVGDETAKVVLQIVHAPFGVHFGVLVFVLITARVAGAGLGAGTGIDTDF